MAQPQVERTDPKPRSLNRDAKGGQVKNKRDDRAYLLANPMDDQFGLAFVLETGWEKIQAPADKERVGLGKVEANGDVTFRGQVLVWLPKEEFEARQADKHAVAKMREQSKSKPGGPDGIRDADGKPATNWKD